MFKGKRILAFVLMVLMLLSLLPAVALAEETTEVSIEGRTNLVTNGDFESDATGWNGIGTKASLDENTGRNGSKSAKLTGNYISTTLTVEDGELIPGHTYRFVVYTLKGDESSAPDMKVRPYYYNAETGENKAITDKLITTVTSNTETWVKHEIEYTMPEATDAKACVQIIVYLRNQGTGTCYFDDFAVYDMDEELYTVTWKNYDGTVLETDTNLAAGITPEYNGATPTRVASGNYVYTFAGWSPEVATVTGDVIYTAQFTGMVNLAANGDFESDATGWSGIGTKASLDENTGRNGSKSAKLTGNYISTTLTVEDGELIPGHTYRFVVYTLKGDESSAPDMKVRPYYYNAETGENKVITDKLITTVTSNTETWVKHEIEYTMPEATDAKACVQIIVYLRNQGTGTCYFDDFAVYDLSAEAPAEKFELKGATVDLGNSLDMNFYIDPANLDANEDYTAKIVRSYADGTADEELTVPVYQNNIDADNGYIYVTYGNIAAKEMGDKIAVTIYDSEGNAVSETYTDSIKEYALRALEKYQGEAETVAVLQDLLNYGAAAQAQFEYDVENPVDSDLTDIRDVAVTGEATANEAKKGTTLTLKSNILMEMFFFKDKVGDATTATVSYTNHRGTEVTDEVSLVADDYYLDAYKVQIEGLVIADINTVVTVTVGDITVTDTMAWFVERSTDADIYSAILALGDSAYAYFH